VKKNLLFVFCCLITYQIFSLHFQDWIVLSDGEGKEVYFAQQGFSDNSTSPSEKHFILFSAKENVAPLKYMGSAALGYQGQISGFLGLSMFRLTSQLFRPLSMRVYIYYALALILMLGILIGFGIFLLRVTKAKRDAEASEAFFRALIDESPLAMVIFQDLKIQYVNPAMESLSGYSQKELLEKEIWQLIHPDSLSGISAENWFLVKKNSGMRFEFRLQNKFQDETWVDFSARLIDFYGKPAFLATALDISDRLQGEVQENNSRDRLSLLHLASNDGVFDYDMSSEELYLSPKWKEVLGFQEHEIENNLTAWESLVHPEDKPFALDLFDHIKKGLVPQKAAEFRLQCSDGTYKWVEVKISVVFDEHNQPIRVLGTQSDVSENRIRNQELITAKEKAEEAAKAKSSFISSVSHEIRTPLNAIIGLVDLLSQDKALNEQQAENLSSLKFSSNHLLGIINDVLDFSKLEAGKINLDKADFNLEQLVNETSRAIEFKASEKGVPIKVRINPNVPQTVIGDAGRLRQVLLNLLGNAVKFTSEGHIDVYVKMLERSGQNCRLRFSVSDTGIGIPEEKRQSIFDSFTQAEVNTFRKYGGTGLGLSISKKLVELQGGEIGLKSIEGIGSTFWFELPLEISEKKMEVEAGRTSHEVKDLHGLRILLVEDDRMNQFVMSQFFKKWNAKIELAENGRLAIEKLSEETYDLVLMDVHMPEMDGFEATQVIRDSSSSVLDHQVPIIALTADVNSETRTRVREAGMNDFVTKPSEPELLFQKVLDNSNLEVKVLEEGKDLLTASGLTEGYELNEIKQTVKAALREIFEDNTGATTSMIQHFMKQIPATLERVNEYIEKEDGEMAAQALHRIKPGFHYLGFSKTANKVEELQEVIRKARAPGDIRKHMLVLERDIKKIMHVLIEILQEIEFNEPGET
jgi:PAS domain S-box-containing protein